MFLTRTHRPRNVDTLRATGILYGDLGTSKAYVIGLAFALAGYASFWLILAVSLLTILIGINYMVICRLYPNGGGVYASVRKRSEIIAMIGAFFLMADYLVTAALSALSAFNYLGVSDPILFSAIAIALVGLLNYFGPRNTGTLAFIVGIAAIIVLTILVFFSVPHLKEAWHNILPLKGKPWTIWSNFVGVIVALSGIEAIANTTGVMKLNRNCTEKNPVVTETSTKAILIVICEVALYTALFTFAAAAITNFQISGGEVNAPGHPNVRDSMLRYMGEVFVGNILGQHIGLIFGWILSVVIGILLLSAVNTSISGLISLQYVMAGDGEFPKQFQKVNRFGVPVIALLVATIIPITLVLLVKNVAALAALYAIGFVGAIATNLGSTSTDFSLDLKWRERSLMFFAFLIMLAIEITLFIDKPHARLYALVVITCGLILRGLAQENQERKRLRAIDARGERFFSEEGVKAKVAPFSILCPLKHKGIALKTALNKSKELGVPLYLLFLREQSVISDTDFGRKWESDPRAKEVWDYAKKHGSEELVQFYYCITDSAPDIIAAYAMRLNAKEIIVELPHHRKSIFPPLRGNFVKKLKRVLPKNVNLVVVS